MKTSKITITTHIFDLDDIKEAFNIKGRVNDMRIYGNQIIIEELQS